MSCSSLLSLLSLQLKGSLRPMLRNNRTSRTISFGPDTEGQQGEKNDHEDINEATADTHHLENRADFLIYNIQNCQLNNK